ncbi:MAG: DUF2293 domain-containing protein [Verrucomicrobia bacterium]|nr:DUF2293 domain-containing protein [Verrucomicrobiota bacterium]
MSPATSRGEESLRRPAPPERTLADQQRGQPQRARPVAEVPPAQCVAERRRSVVAAVPQTQLVVGRSAAGRALEPRAIEPAAAAHIRHARTDYDTLLMQGVE